MAFVDLDGIAEAEVQGVFVRSPSAAIRALREHRVASLSGDRGAVTVWRDDAGKLHGDFSRWRITQDSIVARSKAELRRWLDRVAPQCT